MLHQGQVTIPASGNIALVKGVTPAATRMPCYEVIVQKNTANAIRVGDSTVTTSTGVAVAASNAAPGPLYLGPYTALSLDLANIFVIGTPSDVVDFVYVK